MSDDTIEDLGGPSPKGRQASPTGTGEFYTGRVDLHHEDGTLEAAEVEISSDRFRRAPTRSLIAALEEAGAELEPVERIEVRIGGEELTLRQTRWEIQ